MSPGSTSTVVESPASIWAGAEQVMDAILPTTVVMSDTFASSNAWLEVGVLATWFSSAVDKYLKECVQSFECAHVSIK